VEAVNERQKNTLVRKIRHHFKDQLQGRTFAVWGLAFKPNTDDMREAPSRVIIEALLQAGAQVRAYDPVALDEARRVFSDKVGLTLCKNAYEVADGADALVIATEWKEFRSPDFDRLKSSLAAAVIFDGRNLYDPSVLQRFGFTYYAIGRGQALRD
jgi:UDPglucose 6-dehydrogenase